jgi:hypothetical protein
MTARCYAVTGTAMTGPHYCGRNAKDADANGRPVCGIHALNPHRTEGIEWHGDRYRYPQGTAGEWRFSKGGPR